MTQEEKKLVFKDLCARLPYNVIVKNIKLNFDGYVLSTYKYQPFCVLTSDLSGGKDQGFSPIEDIRAYLRPMSSMTKEEKKELEYSLFKINAPGWVDETYGCITFAAGNDFIDTEMAEVYVDWLLSHHFDFRDMISKGLAIEAPKDMY